MVAVQQFRLLWLALLREYFMFTFRIVRAEENRNEGKNQVIIGMACKCDDVLNVFGIKPISSM